MTPPISFSYYTYCISHDFFFYMQMYHSPLTLSLYKMVCTTSRIKKIPHPLQYCYNYRLAPIVPPGWLSLKVFSDIPFLLMSSLSTPFNTTSWQKGHITAMVLWCIQSFCSLVWLCWLLVSSQRVLWGHEGTPEYSHTVSSTWNLQEHWA